ncbi:MAG: hypothetical protein RI965_346 [Bacteroidota bacterium]|jgi:hypothetical protein
MTKETEKTQEKVEDLVSLERSELEKLMDRIKRLESAADKAQLARFDEANKGKLTSVVRLRKYQDKVVLSWDNMIKNTVEKSPKGGWSEDQSVKLNYADGTSEEVDLVIFNRYYTHISAEVLSETNDKKSGALFYDVLTSDGDTLKIDTRFLN